MRAKLSYILIAAILGLLALSPFLSGTGTVPLAIVDGNSMYPALQNGDLVIFTHPNGVVPNGTIIIYAQGSTGDKVLDTLMMPIVIHRVVGTVVQSDGVVYYRTKGDNNQFDDPQLVRESSVLGVPALVLPRIGVPILFLKSAQGLITIVACIVFLSLNSYEVKRREDELKNKFLSRAALLVLNGELSKDMFERLELYTKYSMDGLNRETEKVLRKIAEGEQFGLESAKCELCPADSIVVETKGEKIVLCQNDHKGEQSAHITDSFRRILGSLHMKSARRSGTTHPSGV